MCVDDDTLKYYQYMADDHERLEIENEKLKEYVKQLKYENNKLRKQIIKQAKQQNVENN